MPVGAVITPSPCSPCSSLHVQQVLECKRYRRPSESNKHELVMSCEEFDSMAESEMSFSPYSPLPLTCLHHISSFPIITFAYALPPPTPGALVFHFEDLSDYEESLQGVGFPPLVSRNSHDHHNCYSGR